MGLSYFGVSSCSVRVPYPTDHEHTALLSLREGGSAQQALKQTFRLVFELPRRGSTGLSPQRG